MAETGCNDCDLNAPAVAGLAGLGAILIPVSAAAAWALDGDLWAEIKEGTFVWRDPTEEEKAAQKERRRKLFQESHVPWILQDLGEVMSAYDDIQDVVAFARWNKKLLVSGNIKKCIGRCMQKGGRSGLDCFFRCACPMGPGGKREAKGAMAGWGALGEAGSTFLGRLAGLSGPMMWALLAGQVSYSAFGVGIKLGPIVGAGLELAFRGLDYLGLPFGPEHNKYHQLKRARVMQRGDQIFGSLPLLPKGEQAKTLVGLSEAYRGARREFETVYGPENPIGIGPRVNVALERLGRGDVLYGLSEGGFIDDAFGVMKAAYEFAKAMPGNLASYVGHDLLGAMMTDLATTLTHQDQYPEDEATKLQRASLRLQHQQTCAKPGCAGVVDDVLTTQEWAEGRGLFGHKPSEFPQVLVKLYPGALTAGTPPVR